MYCIPVFLCIYYLFCTFFRFAGFNRAKALSQEITSLKYSYAIDYIKQKIENQVFDEVVLIVFCINFV